MSNLSRLKKSQVKQTLWFNYDVIDKLPALIKDIKSEIIDSCPNLIKDGSRPFRVSWTNYKDTHLELVVNCHFRHPPSTDIYWDTRQDVLLAVGRAAKKANIRFEIPSVRVQTTGKHEVPTTSTPQQLYGIEEGEKSV
jgi:small-conductance mechanosensitive channel